MPPLQLFGRTWHVSSDDLVLPGTVGVMFHGTWSALLIVDAAFIGLPDDCPEHLSATSSVLMLLLSFVLTTCLQVWVTVIALKGAMLEDYKRKRMPVALYLLLTAYCLEAAALTMTTVVFHGIIGKDVSCYTTEELARTAMADLAVQNWFIYSTWAALGAVGGTLVLLYNLYPDRSLDAWVDRVTCLSYVLCCRRSLGTSNVSSSRPSVSQTASATPTVLRLAKVLGDVFYPLNFSFTDIVAAITLVGITHRSKAHGTGSSSHTHAVIAAAAAGLFQKGRLGEEAFAEAAAALAAAQTQEYAMATAAASSCLHSEVLEHSAGLQQSTSPVVAAAAGEVPKSSNSSLPRHRSKSGPAATGMPVTRSHQQLLQLLLDDDHGQQQRSTSQVHYQQAAASVDSMPDAVGQHSVQSSEQGSRQGSWVSGDSPKAGARQLMVLPSVLRSRLAAAGLHRASSDGDVTKTCVKSQRSETQRSSSEPTTAAVEAASNASAKSINGNLTYAAASAAAAGTAETPTRNNSSNPMSHGRSYRSAWEQAVRQASSLAVAPGYGVNPANKFLPTAAQPRLPKVSHIGNRYSEDALYSESRPPLQLSGASRAYSWACEAPVKIQEEQAGATVTSKSPPSSHARSNQADEVVQLKSQCKGQTSCQNHSKDSCLRDSGKMISLGSEIGPSKPSKHVSFEDDVSGDVGVAAAAAAVPEGSPCGHAVGSNGVAEAAEAEEEEESSSVALELLEEALHWHRYANAIYGWPMFLWSHRYRVLRCCGLCCGRCFKCVQRQVQASNSAVGSSSSSSGQSRGMMAVPTVRRHAAEVHVRGQQGCGPVAEGLEAGMNDSLPAALDADSPERQQQQQRQQQHQQQEQKQVCVDHEALTAASDSTQHTSMYKNHDSQHCMQKTSRIGHESAAREDRHVTTALSSIKNGVVPTDSVTIQHCSSTDLLSNTERCVAQEHLHEQQLDAQRDEQQSTAATLPTISNNARMHDMTRSTMHTAANLSTATAAASTPGIDGSTADQHACRQVSSTAAAAAAASAESDMAAMSSSCERDAAANPRSCCGCLDGVWGTSHVPKMAPLTTSQRLTREAIIQTAKIPDSALLYVSYSNLVEGLLPYSVVLDEARQCVVVAIRGSLSVEDCVTDVLYDPAPLDADWLQPATNNTAATTATTGKEKSSRPVAAICKEAQKTNFLDEHLPAASGAGEGLEVEADDAHTRPNLQQQVAPRQSPFATAAAAAAHAAEVDSHGHPEPVINRNRPAQQPSVPVAQAAAAAAAAASAASGANAGCVDHSHSQVYHPDTAYSSSAQRQQQQQHADKLAKQPSFWRTRLPTYQSCDLGTSQQQQHTMHHHRQQQQPPSPPRQHQQQQQQQQGLHSHASGAFGPGLLPGLSSLKTALHHVPSVRRKSSHQNSSLLPTTANVNFMAAPAAGDSTSQPHHHSRSWIERTRHHQGVLRSTRSLSLPGGNTTGMLQQQHRSTAQVQMLGQVQRTTAADRALGAAREGHRLGGSHSATSQSLWQQQQQGQLQSAGPSAAAAAVLGAAAADETRLEVRSGSSRQGDLCKQHNQQQQQQHKQQSGLGLHHQHRQQQQQQQSRLGLHQAASVGQPGQHLLDGGPTDVSLMSQAAAMNPSSTAAVPARTTLPIPGCTTAEMSQRQTCSPELPGPTNAAEKQCILSTSSCGIESELHLRCTDLPQAGQQQQLEQSMRGGPCADAAAKEQDAAASAAAAAQAAAAEETPDTGAAGDQWFAHEGILNCARAIRDDLRRLGLLDQLLLGRNCSSGSSGWVSLQQQLQHSTGDNPLSSDQLPDCRGWTLVLTGHSLGAGVAALLALHYRSLYPDIRCWCFGPPGGLMSPAAAASLKDICYSLVSAKDMVPRMSLWTIERLRDEMMLCALRCKMPKWKLLLGAAFGRLWEEHEVLRPLEELTPAQAEQYRRYRRAVNEERSLDPLRVRIAREFVPPGKVIWLERYKITRPRLRLATPADRDAAATTINIEQKQAASSAATVELQASSSHAAAAKEAPVLHDNVISTMGPSQPGPAKHPDISQAAGSSNMIMASSAAFAAALAAAPAAVAGTVTVTRLRPHVTDGLNLIVGGMVVSRNMFLDHVPDAQIAELKRLVKKLRRQVSNEHRAKVGSKTAAAARTGAAEGSCSMHVMAPKQQGMPQRL